MKYEQIADLLYGLAERFDWDKIMEGDHIIGLKQVEASTFFVLIFSLISFWFLYFYDLAQIVICSSKKVPVAFHHTVFFLFFLKILQNQFNIVSSYFHYAHSVT